MKRQDWKQHSEELQQQASEMIHDIGKKFVNSPETIAEVLAFGSRFYNYSPRNMMLIYSQNRGATYVQSFDAWKKEGTGVRKGEHGIKIFVPVKSTYIKLDDKNFVRLSEADPEQKAALKEGKLKSFSKTFFRVGNVFDIAQTSFPKERYPELYSMGYDSPKLSSMINGLEVFCRRIGVEVSVENLSSISRRGYYKPGEERIALSELLNDSEKLSTLTHEIGHALEMHGSRDVSTVQKEFEADCISILLQSDFGIEISDTRKAHLAEHYRKFENEIRAKNPAVSEEELVGKIESVMSASLDVFRQHIDDIHECVEKEIHQERGKNMIYKYYFDQAALNKGSYPIGNFEGITEYGKLTSVPEINQKVLGELRYSEPLTKEQEREYGLISGQVDTFEREEAEEDNEFKSTITASERVEGLTFEMWNDGSGSAWLNGESLGSIDLATKEIEIGKRDFILSDNTADEIKSEFREKIEKLAIEKGAKKISADTEEEAVSGNKKEKDADSVSRKQPLNEKQQNEEVQKPAPVCARRHRGR